MANELRLDITDDEAYREIINTGKAVRQRAENLIQDVQSGTRKPSQIAPLIGEIDAVRARFAQLASTPGLGAYVRNRWNDQNVNLSAVFNNFDGALLALRNEIAVNFVEQDINPSSSEGQALLTRLSAVVNATQRS